VFPAVKYYLLPTGFAPIHEQLVAGDECDFSLKVPGMAKFRKA
jgi:hypothetical protein